MIFLKIKLEECSFLVFLLDSTVSKTKKISSFKGGFILKVAVYKGMGVMAGRSVGEQWAGYGSQMGPYSTLLCG